MWTGLLHYICDVNYCFFNDFVKTYTSLFSKNELNTWKEAVVTLLQVTAKNVLGSLRKTTHNFRITSVRVEI